MTYGVTFDPGETSHSALSLAPAAGHSTAGPAGHSLHLPGGGSGFDRLTSPKPEDLQTAAAARQGQKHRGCRSVRVTAACFMVYSTLNDIYLHPSVYCFSTFAFILIHPHPRINDADIFIHHV